MYTKSVLLAAALGLQQAAATQWNLNAPAYKCPGSTPTKCSPNQQGGWNFGGIPNGALSGFDGFGFSCGASGVSGSGWSCNSQFQGKGGKRSLFPRHGGGGGGQCAESDLKDLPTISCSDRDFTAATFDLISDFDVSFIMECDQGSGQKCQQSGSCSKSGSSFQNTQCAGCKSITFKPSGGFSGSCGFGISSIGWECSSSTSVPSLPSPTGTPGSTSAVATASTTAASVPTGGSSPSGSSPSGSSPSQSTSALPTPTVITTLSTSTVFSTTEITITSCAPTVTSCPAHSTTVVTSTISQYTTVCPVTLTQTPGQTPSSSAQASPSSTSVALVPSSSSAAAIPSSTSVAAVPSSTLVTIASSSAQAQGSSTQPAPAPGTTQEVVTTIVISESTTICPVTATLTPTGGSVTTPVVTTSLSTSTLTITSVSTICTQCVAPASSSAQAQPSSQASSGPSPVSSSSPQASSPAGPGSPCPTVVPSCLNSWMFTTTCKDNTDVGCFCQLANYTSSVIGCISAYGATPSEISSAIAYLQGICAPYVSSNPGVVTGVPQSISAAPLPGQPMTTLTITGGSSPTTVTVPAVQFTTYTSASAGATGAPAPGPGLVPGTASPIAPQSSAAAGVSAPYPTGSAAPTGASPSGTGAITGANPTSTVAPFQGAASKGAVSGLVGFGAVMMAVLVL